MLTEGRWLPALGGPGSRRSSPITRRDCALMVVTRWFTSSSVFLTSCRLWVPRRRPLLITRFPVILTFTFLIRWSSPRQNLLFLVIRSCRRAGGTPRVLVRHKTCVRLWRNPPIESVSFRWAERFCSVPSVRSNRCKSSWERTKRT